MSSSVRGVPKKTWQPTKAWADLQEEQEHEDDEEDGEQEEIVEEQEEPKAERWVGAFKEEGGSPRSKCAAAVIHDKFIMFDSGSDEQVCKEAFGGRGEEQMSKVKLNAVSGDALSILGERKVIITLAGRKGPVDLEVVFQVSRNAQKNILSSGKLFRAGFKTIMNPEGQSYLEHHCMEDQTPLYMHGNSFYLRIMEVRAVPGSWKSEQFHWSHMCVMQL